MTTTHPTEVGSGRSGARIAVVGSTLALGAIAVASMLIIRPWGERDELGYADIAPVRDGMWSGVLVDSLGFAAIGVCLGLVVCALARSRGSAWATGGAVLTGIGGVAFAMGAFAFASLAWHATETSVIGTAEGTRLLDYVEDNPGHVLVPQMAGFLLLNIGVLVLSVALLRAGTVSRFIPIAIIVLTFAQFSPVPGRVLDFIQVTLMAVLVALAGSYVKSSR